MLNIEKPANEIWETVESHINRWLEERQTLITSYCELSGIKAYGKSAFLNQRKLQTFCEQLVDYASKGHFEIYEELTLEAKAFSNNALALDLEKIYSKIETTTEIALEFNDKYDLDKIQPDLITTNLPSDLSKIGEAIALRFDLEDRLINALHRNNKDIAA